MPTMFSHPATVVALSAALGSRVIPWRLAVFAVFCAIIPDADVLSFKLGIAYGSTFGHRGFSHSLLFALFLGIMGLGLGPVLGARRFVSFFVVFFAAASHIFLDALTDGGLGVAAFWPWLEQRFFFAWRPIDVSPISPRAFFGGRGVDVMLSELRWVWLPSMALGFLFFLLRRTRS